MKKAKCLWTVLLLILALACLLCFTACSKDETQEEGEHVHQYTSTTVPATCSQKGLTTYTCTCGHTYTEEIALAEHSMTQGKVVKEPTCDQTGLMSGSVCSACGYTASQSTVIKALGHRYKSDYSYPTTTSAGSKTMTCSVCGDRQTETLSALTVNMPAVSSMLAEMLGTTSCSLSLDEDSRLVLVRELSDYTFADGSKIFFDFSLVEAVVDSDAENFAGHFKFDIDLYPYTLDGSVPAEDVECNEDEKETYSLYVYVNNEDVSVEIDGVEQNVNGSKLTELFYDAMGAQTGAGYEQAAQLNYVMSELITYAPLLEELVELAVQEIPSYSGDYSKLLDALDVLGKDLIEKSTAANGNVTYTVDVAALKKITAGLESKTVADCLEEIYGADIAAVVVDFLKALPTTTVKDVADVAISAAQRSDVELEDIYTLIDLYVYYVTGEEISFGEIVYTRYDKTVSEVVAELSGMSGQEAADLVREIDASFLDVANGLDSTCLVDLLGMDSAEIMGDINEFIDTLDEKAVVQCTLDSSGAPVAIDIGLAEEGYRFSCEIDGNEISALVRTNGVEMTINASEDGASFEIKDATGATQLSGGLTVEQTANGVDLEMSIVPNGAPSMTLQANVEVGDTVNVALSVMEGNEVFATLTMSCTEREMRIAMESEYADAILTATENELYVCVEDDYGEIFEMTLSCYVQESEIDASVSIFVEDDELFEMSLSCYEQGNQAAVSVKAGIEGEDILEVTLSGQKEGNQVSFTLDATVDGESVDAQMLCADGVPTLISFEGFGCTVRYADSDARALQVSYGEVYVAIAQNGDTVTLLAQEDGETLCELIARANEDGFYAFTAIDGVTLFDGAVSVKQTNENELQLCIDVPKFTMLEYDQYMYDKYGEYLGTYTETVYMQCDIVLNFALQ